MTTSPLTEQQLNATIYDALAAFTGVACWNVLQYAQNRQYLAEHLTEALAPLLLAEVRRLQDRVTELETYARGCDAEGCILPHSSWCDAAKKTAAANNGCTCGQPWTGHPQPHAMHCWVVNPPRAEVEEMRREIARLQAAAAAAPAV